MKTRRSLLALALCLCCVFSMVAVISFRANAATTVTYVNVQEAAKTIADTVESKNALPVKVNCGSSTVTPAQFMYLASKVIVALNNGTKSGTLAIPSMNKAPHPQGSVKAYNMYKSEYVVRAQKIITFMNKEKAAPNYCTCNGGTLKYQDAVFALAKILRYYKQHNALPNYCYVANRTWKADVTVITEPAPAPATKTVTYANIQDAAKTVADYCESKKALPASVSCGGQTINMGQFMMLTCQVIGKLNAGTKSGSFEIPNVKAAPNPNGSCKKYNMMKTEYVSVAAKVVTFMQKEKAAPNYCTCNGGQLKFPDAVYALARVLRYYKQNGALPNYTVTKPVSGTAASSTTTSGSWLESTAGYKKFLKATKNCQVGNATLKSVAQTGIKYGGTPSNMYTAAKHLVQYLNDKTSYSYYYNTRKGALGTWNARSGNCCDMAHLVNACARSVGIPGAYHNTTCRFSNGVYGHVYADLWCGKAYGWKVADIVNSANYLGYKTNVTISDNHGRMAEITF